MALIDKIVNYYKFDEASGALIDVHSADNGTIVNTVTQNEEGIINTGYLFGGAGYVTLPTVKMNGTKFAVAGWVKVLGNSSDATIYQEYSVSNHIFIDGAFQSLKFSVLKKFDTTNATAKSSELYLTGYDTDWFHFVANYDNGTWELYINDTPDTQSGVSGVGTPAGDNGLDRFQFGANYFRGTSGQFKGRLDEWGFYNDTLAVDEIHELFIKTPYPFSTTTYISQNAKMDENNRPTLICVDSADGISTVPIQANATNHGLEIDDDTTGSDNGNNSGNAMIDENGVSVLTALSSDDDGKIVEIYAEASTGKIMIDSN